MASLLTHPALPVGMYIASSHRPQARLLYYCILLSMLPDADSLGFKLGVPYHSQWGHRGFTHSLVFAMVMAFLLSLFHKKFEASRKKTFLWGFLAAVSHPVFDSFTNGGLGVALFWPFSFERFFAPIHPVEVSPIGIVAFFSSWGVRVLISEILWIWTPVLILSFGLRKLRKPNILPM
jgi:inner membrane protein